jgi:hypothetical protein
VTTKNWQDTTNGGCHPNSCSYIQFHGKGDSTCPTDQAFLSSGFSKLSKQITRCDAFLTDLLDSSALSWYENDTRPIRRLQGHLQEQFPLWNASTPADDKGCSLSATLNVFGRYVNGVDEEDVCVQPASSVDAAGEFIHIEQATVSRISDAFEGWAAAIAATFAGN